jgi:membrane protein DedA with SNARE-associated domain
MDPAQFTTLQQWLLEYRYWIIFPITLIEGPVLMVLCGILWKLGYFSFAPLFFVLAVADLAADVIWYAAGRWGGHKFVRTYGKYLGLDEALILKVERRFLDHGGKILFLSKITMGLGLAIAIIVAAGMMRVNFRKFLLINGLGQAFWTLTLLSVGYFFGNFYHQIDKGFRYASLAGFIILVYFILTGFKSYLRKRTEKNQL